MRSPAGELLKAEMKRAIFEEKKEQIQLTEVKRTKSKEIINNTNANSNIKSSGSNNNNNSDSEKFEMSVDDDFEKPRGDVKKKQKKVKKTEEKDKEKKEKKESKKKKTNSKKKNKKENEEKDNEDEFSDREAVIISETEWPPRWHKLLVEFDDGTKMAFSDPRR